MAVNSHSEDLRKVEFVPGQIKDAHGAISQPLRVVDTLAAMARAGTITAAMLQAANQFRASFAKAHLVGLRAADISRCQVSGKIFDSYLDRIDGARRATWQALRAVGGLSAKCGSILWHVVGCEQSLRQWVEEQRAAGHPMNRERASGFLIAALEFLVTHYDLDDFR